MTSAPITYRCPTCGYTVTPILPSARPETCSHRGRRDGMKATDMVPQLANAEPARHPLVAPSNR